MSSVVIKAKVNFLAKNWYPKISDITLNISPINCQKNKSVTGRNALVNNKLTIQPFMKYSNTRPRIKKGTIPL